MEIASLIYYIIAFVVFLIIVIAILTRLRLIVNNTFKIHKHPVLSHYAEARIYELTGDKKYALQEYYRCYVAFKSMRYNYIFISGAGKLTLKDIEEKIEQLGGDSPGSIMKPEKKAVD
jgi:hypothetical protein